MLKKESFLRDLQYAKFSLYGALKNLKFFDPFIILFFREAGLSFLEIGVLFSVREIANNILEVPTGVIADAYGRKKAMIFSFSAYILSFLIFYFLPSFSMFMAAMILFATGEAFRSGTHKAMILEYLKIKGFLKYKVDYYGHTRGWSQAGSAISALIAALLVFYTGTYRVIFIASVIPYLLNMVLILTYPSVLDGEKEISEKVESVFKRSLKRISGTLGEFKGVFRNKYIFRAFINGSFFDAVFRAVKDYLQPVLKQYAVLLPIFVALEEPQKRTSLVIGVVYFLLFFLTSLSARSSGKISTRLSLLSRALNVTYLIGVILTLLSGIFLILQWYIPSIVLFVIFYMLENLKRPMNVGYFSDLFSNRVMATGFSVETQIKTIFMAVLAPIMGFLADNFGVGFGLMGMGILLFIAYPLAFLKEIEKTEEQEKDPPLQDRKE
ncbi:MAG: MFS transporter [Spirochaetes bacterium]|nr:MAG: MFS transporter [Spirochaetota bacterium]